VGTINHVNYNYNYNYYYYYYYYCAHCRASPLPQHSLPTILRCELLELLVRCVLELFELLLCVCASACRVSRRRFSGLG
jgi:hypothetical protein